MPKRKPSPPAPSINAAIVERVGLSSVKRVDGSYVHRSAA